MILDKEKKPWERQDAESTKAWLAFQTFRDLGEERTMDKAGRALGCKSMSNLYKWATDYHWQARAASWDRHVDIMRQKLALKDAEKKAKEKLQVADGMWRTAAKGLVMWSKYLDIKMKQQEEDGDKAKAPPISPGDVYRLAESGVKLSQLLEDKPTDIQEKREILSMEQRREKMQKLVGNPRIRAVMKEITKEVKEESLRNGDLH